MNRYISIEAVLNRIPDSIKESTSEGWLLSRALDAYRDLHIPGRLVDDIAVVPIHNKLAVLPRDIKKINLVTYQCSEPSACEVEDFLCTNEGLTCDPCKQDCDDCEKEALDFDSRTEEICRHTINYQIWLDSNIYNRHYLPLKFVGESVTTMCKGCINRKLNNCRETFSVTPEGNLLTSIDSGYLCVDYKREPRGENGEFLILDDPKLIQGLSLYAEAMAWRNRRGYKEQSSDLYYRETLNQAEIVLKSFKGRQRLKAADSNLIRKISFVDSDNQKLIRLPGLYLSNNNLTF